MAVAVTAGYDQADRAGSLRETALPVGAVTTQLSMMMKENFWATTAMMRSKETVDGRDPGFSAE